MGRKKKKAKQFMHLLTSIVYDAYLVAEPITTTRESLDLDGDTYEWTPDNGRFWFLTTTRESEPDFVVDDHGLEQYFVEVPAHA